MSATGADYVVTWESFGQETVTARASWAGDTTPIEPRKPTRAALTGSISGRIWCSTAARRSIPDAAYGDSIVLYEWDVDNDGQIDYAGANAVVPWADIIGLPQPAVSIPVTLRVTDGSGLTHSAQAELTIFDNRPGGLLHDGSGGRSDQPTGEL